MTVRIRLFGDVELVWQEEVVARNRKLLVPIAAIAIQPSRRLHRDDVYALVWPGPREKARNSLRQARNTIRELCEDPCLILEDGFLSIAPGVAVDLWEFNDAIEEAQHRKAVEIYRGELAQTLSGDTTGQLRQDLDAAADRVRRRLRAAYEALISDELLAGRPDLAIAAAQALVSNDPLDERAQELLIRTNLAAGSARGASAALGDYTAELVAIDEEPSARLAGLIDEDPEISIPTPPPISTPPAAPERKDWRHSSGLFFAGALVSAILAAMLWPGQRPWPGGARIELPVEVAGVGAGATLVLGRGTTTLLTGDPLPLNSVPLSGSSTYAHALEVTSGYDLVVVEGNDTTVLRSEEDDEHPLAWSPYGERVLYDSGRSIEGGYETELRWIDLTTGEDRLLRHYSTNPSLRAAWSPDGITIAVVEYLPDSGAETLTLFAPSGDVVAEIPVSLAGAPNWSPDGERLVFLDASQGQTAVVSVDRDGQNRRRHVPVPGELRSPVWLTDQIIVFVSDFGNGGDVWAWDDRAGALAQVTERGDIVSVRSHAMPRRSFRWLHAVSPTSWAKPAVSLDDLGKMVRSVSLSIPRAPALGESFEVFATATWDDGRVAPLRSTALTWASTEGATLTSTPGVFRLDAAHPVVVSADLRGWQDAEIEITPALFTQHDPPLAFEEVWRDPASAEGWQLFGEPLPTIDFGAGEFRGNGDDSYLSGAISRRQFDLSQGATLEVEGRVPLNGGIFQDFALGFVSAPPAESSTPSFPDPRDLLVMIESDGVRVRSGGPQIAPLAPLPTDSPIESLYSVQIEPTGLVTVLIDGRVHTRGMIRAMPESAHIVLGANSIGADIVHGTVSLFTGPKYLPSER